MRTGMLKALLSAAAAAMLAIVPVRSVHAVATPQSLAIELNNATDNEGGCSLTFKAVNGTGELIGKASYEIVVFDPEDKAVQFLIMEFGRLLAGKTKVVAFDFPNRKCGEIKSILVNDAAACEIGGEESLICLDRLATSTRNGMTIGFGQ